MIDAADPRVRPMLTVAGGLGQLASEVVFVGSSVTALLVTDPGAPAIRPTDDVDLIVNVATNTAYYALPTRTIPRRTSIVARCRSKPEQRTWA